MWVEIGIVVHDSQCGLRAYPLRLFDVVRCWAGRFGFEAEIIARAVWAGCPLVDVPVRCYYPPHDERVSHLKPWRDGAKGFFMHWGLAIRRLIPWPEPKLGGVSAEEGATAKPPAECVSGVEAPRRLKPAARDEGGMAKPTEQGAEVKHTEQGATAKPAEFTSDKPQTDRGGRRRAHPQAEQGAESQEPCWSGVPRRPKTGLTAWRQWASPFSLWGQIRSSRLEQVIASTAFGYGVFLACLPFGLWTFAVAAYSSKRLHHNLWAVMLGAALSIPPIGLLLAKLAISVIYVPTHFAWPDFPVITPGVHYAGTLFRAYPISWCIGGVLLGTVLHWVTLAVLTWLLRRISVRER